MPRDADGVMMGYVAVYLTAVPPGGNGTDGARAGCRALCAAQPPCTAWQVNVYADNAPQCGLLAPRPSAIAAAGGGAPPAAYGNGNPRGGWPGGELAIYSGGRAPRS
eukprot:gene36451-7129_t